MRRMLAIMAVLALTGCVGGASDAGFSPAPTRALSDGSTATDHGSASAEGGRVTIRMGEFYFSPTVITAPAGSTLTVDLIDAGSNVHDFEIPGQIDITLAQQEHETVQVQVPATGAVTFQCKFHLPRGMRGEVRAG